MAYLSLGPELIIDAACTREEISLLLDVITPFREEEIWQERAQRDLRDRILDAVPRMAVVRDKVEECLLRDPHCCVLRGSGFDSASDRERVKFTAGLSLLFGDLSHSNVADDKSGKVFEFVTPTQKEGRDVTYTLGACEPHADESSKTAPEDVACLWCVRQASWGGATTVWPVRKLMSAIAEMPEGDALIRLLRTKHFPFGGKLRQPPRVLTAPILFGEEGIRFRLGTIEDAFNVLRQEPDSGHTRALQALVGAIESTTPYGYRLASGEALIALNRQVLHAREDFDDAARLLIRTRLYNARLSISSSEQGVSWRTGSPPETAPGRRTAGGSSSETS